MKFLRSCSSQFATAPCAVFCLTHRVVCVSAQRFCVRSLAPGIASPGMAGSKTDTHQNSLLLSRERMGIRTYAHPSAHRLTLLFLASNLEFFLLPEFWWTRVAS